MKWIKKIIYIIITIVVFIVSFSLSMQLADWTNMKFNFEFYAFLIMPLLSMIIMIVVKCWIFKNETIFIFPMGFLGNIILVVLVFFKYLFGIVEGEYFGSFMIDIIFRAALIVFAISVLYTSIMCLVDRMKKIIKH